MDRAGEQGREVAWDFGEPADLGSVAADWDDLVSRAGFPPFMRVDFLRHATNTFGCEGGQLVLGRCQGQLVVGGLMVPSGLRRWVTYQPSQLPLGAWIMDRRLSWESLVPGLCSALPGYVLGLSVTQQDPLVVPRPAGNGCADVLGYVTTGWIDVDGAFDDFWNARGQNLRQNLRKQRRKLEERGGAVRFEWLTDPCDVDAAFLEFAALESAGWKAPEGTAISENNTQGRFYRAMLASYAARVEAFAMRLTVDGKPVAVDFGVRDTSTLVILKTTYDESLKAYSPGQLLHKQAFELIFRERLAKRIEFYGKLMEWHSRWTEQSRMLFHVNAYRSPLVRRIGGAARDLRARFVSLRQTQALV